MNHRSEVHPRASRPIESMVWIDEIESEKSFADLKRSFTISGAKLQMNFKVS